MASPLNNQPTQHPEQLFSIGQIVTTGFTDDTGQFHPLGRDTVALVPVEEDGLNPFSRALLETISQHNTHVDGLVLSNLPPEYDQDTFHDWLLGHYILRNLAQDCEDLAEAIIEQAGTEALHSRLLAERDRVPASGTV